MINDIPIGPFTIHMYGIMIAIGLFSALYLSLNRAKKAGMNQEVIWDLFYCILIGGVVGCKVLYWIVEIPDIIEDPSILLDFSGGWVIYGGILGGMLTTFLYCHKKKVDFLAYLDLLIPTVSLAQGFGRLGCFFAGCCYGKETDSWFHITYTISKLAPNNVNLIPTQLMSSFGDFCFCGLLLLFARTKPKKGRVFAGYMFLYSIGRFFIEFFRDDYRGSVGPFSTSQFVSICIFVLGIVVWFLSGKQKEIETATVSANEETVVTENVQQDVTTEEVVSTENETENE